MLRLSGGVFGAVLALGASLLFAAPPPVRLALPGRGDVLVTVPAGWAQSRDAASASDGPTLSLSQLSGATFSVHLSVLPGSAPAGSIDPAAVRALVAEAAKRAQSQSVEKTLAIRDLAGANGHGYYFLATDRAPAPGEWKYLTQGAVGAGSVLVVFTILTNDGQDDIAAAALDMVRKATFQPPATST